MIRITAFSIIAITALLANSHFNDAEAKGGKVASPARSTIAMASYGPPPVVRDRRANPQPWSLPRHWHKHWDHRR